MSKLETLISELRKTGIRDDVVAVLERALDALELAVEHMKELGIDTSTGADLDLSEHYEAIAAKLTGNKGDA